MYWLKEKQLMNEDRRITYIYCLKCPITKSVMYVGQSYNPESRVACHIKDSNKENEWYMESVNLWIKHLSLSNMKPILDILDICNKENAFTFEKAWIRYYSRNGNTLLNKIHNPNYKIRAFKPKRTT